MQNYNTNQFNLQFALQHCGKFCFDTRLIKQGDVFIALNGSDQKQDGHSYIEQAISQGAAFCIVKNSYKTTDVTLEKHLIYCLDEDILTSVSKVAKDKILYYKNHGTKVLAITGSVGKTTTKNFAKFCLEKLGVSCYATHGNYNNHIGLPYTILQSPIEAQFVVLEMGMDKPLEIKHLTHIAHPHIAIITAIGESHLQNFSSTKQIAFAKGECIELTPLTIVPQNISHLSTLKQIAAEHKNKIRHPSFRLAKYNVAEQKTMFNIKCGIFTIASIALSRPITEQYLQNLLLVLQALKILGIKINKQFFAKINFDEFFNGTHLKGRGQWVKGFAQNYELTIIDESYNASPTSMKNALKNLQLLQNNSCGVILGDMLELGPEEIKMHEDLAEHILKTTPNFVALVGDRMLHLHKKLAKTMSNNLFYFANHQQLLEPQNISAINEHLNKNNIKFLLIKSSNSTKLTKIVEYFTASGC